MVHLQSPVLPYDTSDGPLDEGIIFQEDEKILLAAKICEYPISIAISSIRCANSKGNNSFNICLGNSLENAIVYLQLEIFKSLHGRVQC